MAKWENFKNNFSLVASWGFRLFINFVAFVGLALIGYELLAIVAQSRWPALDTVATYIGTILTISGTLCTALSIYFYSDKPTPPEKISIYVTAPIVSTACVIAIWHFVRTGSMPPHILNGFALLAIAGALLRIHPHPLKDERIYWKHTTTT